MFFFPAARINDGGTFPTHQGSVEVYVNGKWSSVCDGGFDDNAASKASLFIHSQFKSVFTQCQNK